MTACVMSFKICGFVDSFCCNLDKWAFVELCEKKSYCSFWIELPILTVHMIANETPDILRHEL